MVSIRVAKIAKVGLNDFLLYLAVITTMFASGANLFVRNIYFFVVSCILVLAYKKKISKTYLLLTIFLCLYVLVDTLFLNVAPKDIKESFLIILRIAGCCIIASSISTDRFKDIFINIMSVLSILSLICFVFVNLKIPLPGEVVIDGWYGTFYHTISHANEFAYSRMRNSGIFNEPGIFQIYINIALLYLKVDKKRSLSKKRLLFYLFVITLLTTKSSMGYLILCLNFILYYIDKPDFFRLVSYISKKSRGGIILVLGLIVVIEEIFVGVIWNIIVSVNSFASRSDDTLISLLIAKDYPLFGVGIATDPTELWIKYYDKLGSLRRYMQLQTARSNGLGNCLYMAGIPFTTFYLYSIIFSHYKMLKPEKIAEKIIVVFIFILFFFEEPIMITPVFLLNFFWQLREKSVGETYEYKKFNNCLSSDSIDNKSY